uniref:Leucine rich repeat containing 3Ca n=1 Tax=Labrus bergylta TaxID=56723 RepID=A0A3Q3MJH5_9LABR
MIGPGKKNWMVRTKTGWKTNLTGDSGGKTVRCSNLQLTEIPMDIPNDTQRIYLDFNLFTTVPTNAFAGLHQLVELDLSHNEPGSSLQFLDLSSNKLVYFNPDAFEGLRARANLTNNPWHCDCNLQMAMPRVDLEPASLTGIVCQTSDPEEIGVQGLAFLLAPDIDLCVVMKRTTDVAMLVIMFGWFSMVISYLVYYVRANQEDARRHLEYLKSLPSRQGKSEESSTISTLFSLCLLAYCARFVFLTCFVFVIPTCRTVFMLHSFY